MCRWMDCSNNMANGIAKFQIPYAVVGGVILFWYWSVALLISTAPLDTTPMYIWKVLADALGLAAQIGRAPIIAAMLFVVGAMTMRGLLMAELHAGHKWMLPQNIILLIQAMGCVIFANAGHYADGTPSPTAHIYADQMPFIIAVAAHTLNVVDVFGHGFITTGFLNLCTKRALI